MPEQTTMFDRPFSDRERLEIAAMPSHEIYLLTKMLPAGTVRGREVRELYAECLKTMARSTTDA
jgi:hypothetical protein